MLRDAKEMPARDEIFAAMAAGKKRNENDDNDVEDDGDRKRDLGRDFWYYEMGGRGGE